MEEDHDILAFGTEIWDFEVADGRDDEFRHAPANSEVVIEFEELGEEMIV